MKIKEWFSTLTQSSKQMFILALSITVSAGCILSFWSVILTFIALVFKIKQSDLFTWTDMLSYLLGITIGCGIIALYQFTDFYRILV